MRVTVRVDSHRRLSSESSKDLASLVRRAVRRSMVKRRLQVARGEVEAPIAPDDRLEISVTLMSDDELRELNREYRGLDRSTDVLSFPVDPDDPHVGVLREAGRPIPIGDICLSIDRITDQSERYGESFERELVRVVVHGALHLIGYDHCTPKERELMRMREAEVLSEI